VALRAIADDGDLLAANQRQVSILIVEDLHRFPF
jgi:hypothetical protein